MSSIPESQARLLEARGKLEQGKVVAESGQIAFAELSEPVGVVKDAKSKAFDLAQAILRKLAESQVDLLELNKLLATGVEASIAIQTTADKANTFFDIAKDRAEEADIIVGHVTDSDDHFALLPALRASADAGQNAFEVHERGAILKTSFMTAKSETEEVGIQMQLEVVRQMGELVNRIKSIGERRFDFPTAAESSTFLGEQALVAFDASIEQVNGYIERL